MLSQRPQQLTLAQKRVIKLRKYLVNKISVRAISELGDAAGIFGSVSPHEIHPHPGRPISPPVKPAACYNPAHLPPRSRGRKRGKEPAPGI